MQTISSHLMGNLIKILIKLMVSLLVFISAKVTYYKKTLMKSTILSFTVSSYMTQQQPAIAMQQQSFPYGAVPQNPMVSNTFSQNHSTWSFLCLKTEDTEDHWNLRALVGQSFMTSRKISLIETFLRGLKSRNRFRRIFRYCYPQCLHYKFHLHSN